MMVVVFSRHEAESHDVHRLAETRVECLGRRLRLVERLRSRHQPQTGLAELARQVCQPVFVVTSFAGLPIGRRSPPTAGGDFLRIGADPPAVGLW